MDLEPELIYETAKITGFDPIRCARLYNELVERARDLAPETFANRNPLPVPNNIPFSYPSNQNPGGRRYIDPYVAKFLQNCILYEEYPVDALLLPIIKPLDPRTFYVYHDWLSPRDADSVICLLALPGDTLDGGLFFDQRTRLARMIQFPWPEGQDEAQHWMPLELILRKWKAYWERGLISLEADDEDDDGEERGDNNYVRMCWNAEEVYYGLMSPGHKAWEALLDAITVRVPAGAIVPNEPVIIRRPRMALQTAPPNPHGTPFSPISPLSPTSLLSQGLQGTRIAYTSPTSTQNPQTFSAASAPGARYGPMTDEVEDEDDDGDDDDDDDIIIEDEEEEFIDSDEERARWNCPEGWYIHSKRCPILRSGQPLRIAPGLIRPSNDLLQADLDDPRQREKIIFAAVDDERGDLIRGPAITGEEADNYMGLFYCMDDEPWLDRVGFYAHDFNSAERRVRTNFFEPVSELGRAVRCPWDVARGVRLRDVLRLWRQCIVEGRWTVGPNGVEGNIGDLYAAAQRYARVRWSRVEL